MTLPRPGSGRILAPMPIARATWSRLLRREIQIALDLAILAGAFVLAYLLRFEFTLAPSVRHELLVQIPLVLLVEFLAILAFGIYSYVWRYIGLAEARGFARAALWSTTFLLALRLLLPDALHAWRVPISVILVNAGLSFGGLLGLRVIRRMVWERHESQGAGDRRRRRTLLVGAGHAGVLAARELARAHRELEVVGFVDDDPEKLGASIHNVRVLGTSGELEGLLARHQVDEVVVTMARASREVLRHILSTCERAGVSARIIPSLFEILEGRVNVARLREIQIEDLLGRDPIRLDEAPVRAIVAGTTVAVTGAGGSIGAELARQVARLGPTRLLLIDRAEPALFEAHRTITTLWPELSVEPVVADCGDTARLGPIFAAARPSLVLHAAAHKHVPLMETNVAEAIGNNVFATQRLAELAAAVGTERFVLISTDKAVRPTSVMGATKRLAEMVLQHVASATTTNFVAVRFGNVLGSTGSVIPLFRRQIEEGGPVTVTHPEMERYFMTIPEAAQLVLQAAAIGKGQDVFVLDMGQPVKILDLATDMIRLAGLVPGRDIEITFSGARPGEKLSEELVLDPSELVPTAVPKIASTRVAPPLPHFGEQLEQGASLVASGDAAALRNWLAELLPEAYL